MLLERRDAHLTADKRAAVAAGHFDYTLSGISLALRDIADCEGDVDAFINTYQVRDLTNPKFVSEIAVRLVKARRAKEALTYLDRAAPSAANRHFGQTEWTDARISALDALKRHDEAQALRLSLFETQLSARHLRAYLDHLPDFDDVEAEQAALETVVSCSNVHVALAFLIKWPDHQRAARLVQTRFKEIDGDHYELLDPAADALQSKHALAAVLLRRALIDFTLLNGRSTRYKHAARHVEEIKSLNAQIKDYGGFETHDQFMARLKATHGRKTGFWPLLRD